MPKTKEFRGKIRDLGFNDILEIYGSMILSREYEEDLENNNNRDSELFH